MSKKIDIGILQFPGVHLSAVWGLIDLFNTANRFLGENRLRTRLVDVEKDLPNKDFFTIVIVPPCLGSDTDKPIVKRLKKWLPQMHERGSLVCSICMGAFILAEAGLLGGRPATTHWSLEDKFKSLFPDVKLDTGQIIVDDGDIITAGGLMAWVDLGLLFVNRFMGASVMLETARFFLVDPNGREQRHYSQFVPKLMHGDLEVLKVQHWLQKNLAKKITVMMMAKKAGLGERTFLRRFHRATGHKPTEYLQQLRISRSREKLERSTKNIEEIAWLVGYENGGTLRKLFQKEMGVSPGEYRRRFNCELGTN